MTPLFIRLAHYFRSHRAVCWLSMAVLFVCFGYFAAQIHLEEDINKLMPSSKNPDGTTKLAFADLKIKDKVFVLFSMNADAQHHQPTPNTQQLSAACDAFVDSLQKDTTLVGDIFYRLDEELLPEAIDYATLHLPAYIDTSAYARFDTLLTREHFVRQMQQNRDDMTGEFGEMFPELILTDPMGIRNVVAPPATPGGSAYIMLPCEGEDSEDDEPHSHFFVADSTVCVAFLTPRYSSTNTGQGSAMFQRMNTLITEFAKQYPQVRISYHGTPASGFYNSTQIKHDLTTTIAGALLLVLVFLVVCFRRWTVVPLLLLPVAFGTLFGLAVMYWIKGEFSLLALGIGGVVLGVAMSYVLHVLTHHKYVGDTDQLLRDQVKPVLMGCITTIGSFAGLLFVNTDLLRDFGLFAGFAILGTTLFSLTYLPQMLPASGVQATTTDAATTAAKSPFPAFLDRLSTYPFDRQRALLVAIGIVSVVAVGAFIVGGTHFDADMHNLGYEAEITSYSERLLSDKTTSSSDKTKYFASKGRTMEEALSRFAQLDRKLDSLQRIGLVKDYTHTNQLLVPLEVQQQRIEAWRRYWTPERLSTVRQLIAQTAPAAGLHAEAFEPFFEAVGRDYEPDALYEAGIVPEGYLSTLMERSYGGDYLVFTSVRCANDTVRSTDSDYMRICDAISSDPNLLVLDTYYYTTGTLMQMSRDFDVLQWLSMGFVFIVLLLSFRLNVRLALLGFAPILLSWLIVLGVMNLFGVQFNLISIIISTFIFGVGVDYSIFVVSGLLGGNLQYHKTAVLLSAIILVVTVSSMLIAQHPAIRSVGFSTLVGLLAAIILSYVVQPAVYRKVKGKSEK